MSAPVLQGRNSGGASSDSFDRSGTFKRVEVRIPYVSGAIGEAKAELFLSGDAGGRGGCVLRLSIDDQSCSLIPVVRSFPDGVELHLGGEAESAAMLDALRGVLGVAAGVTLGRGHGGTADPLPPKS
jgi:hypothetical protein